MASARTRVPRWAGMAFLGAAVVNAVGEVWQLFPPSAGNDYASLRPAAEAVLHGTPIYQVPSFVYSPTAAVALLPLAAVTSDAAAAGWTVACLVALIVAVFLITRAVRPGARRLPFAALATFTLAGGVAAHWYLWSENLSILLVPVAVGVSLAFHRGRWLLGCALLVVSLLLKPLLVPLLLVPVLHRRWKPLARTVVPGGLVSLAALFWVPGGIGFIRVFAHVLAGSNLHGREAVNNLSIRGWAEAHHWPGGVGMFAATAVALITLWRAATAAPPVPVGGLLLVGTFLAGGLSEVNYLPVAAGVVLLHLALGRRIRPGPAVLGVLLLMIPAALIGSSLVPFVGMQTLFVAAELLMWLGLLHDLTRETSWSPEREDLVI